MSKSSFRKELQRSPIDVPRAALVFAREIAYPHLQVDLYTRLIEQLVEWSREVVLPARTPPAKVKALGEFLFRRFGFMGNAANYSDPRNSYLNEVLDRRLGIPISLSVIYVAVAQGLGLQAQGVGLPGHFIVRVDAQEGPLFIDPFHGGIPLSVEDCARLVQLTTGYQGEFEPEWLEPASPRDILARMLNNLRNVYVEGGDWPSAISVLERLRLVYPDHAEYLLDLGLIHHQHGSLRRAVNYYEQYIRRAPDAPAIEEVLKNLQAAADRLALLN